MKRDEEHGKGETDPAQTGATGGTGAAGAAGGFRSVKRPVTVQVLAGACACAGVVLVWVFLRAGTIEAVIAAGLCAGAAHGLFAAVVLRSRHTRRHMGRAATTALFAAGALLRLLVSYSRPDLLSDDVYRYLWDGRVQLAGINPYRFTPLELSTRELAGDTLFALVPHPDTRTIYPPLSQLFFAAVYALGGGRFWPLRLVYLAADVAIAVCLWRVSRSRSGALVYWLCPLLIVETYAGMHVELLGILPLVAGLAIAARPAVPRRTARRAPSSDTAGTVAAAVCAAAAMVKYPAAVALPVLLFRRLRRHREAHDRRLGGGLGDGARVAARDLLAATLVCALASAPYLGAGRLIVSRLGFYLRHWSFNGMLEPLLRAVFAGDAVYARLALCAAALCLILWRRSADLWDAVQLSILALLATSAVVHPWYLLWLLPFVVMAPRGSVLYLLEVVFLSYVVRVGYLSEGVWLESPLVRVVQYVPFALAFAAELLGRNACTAAER